MLVKLLRGLPGSGKTAWIRRNNQNAIVCSADDYRINSKGEYVFRAEDSTRVHSECFLKFLRVCQISKPEDRPMVLYVDNTNLTAWELAPYVLVAEAFGFYCEIIRVECDWLIAARRNIHLVPTDKMFSMWQTLMSERLPSPWRETIVLSDIAS